MSHDALKAQKQIPGATRLVPERIEARLVKIIKGLERAGQSPSLKDFRDIVKEYFDLNRVKINRFSDNRPGPEWTREFLKRNYLLLKKPVQMINARKAVTADPFVVYDYFQLLENTMKNLGIGSNDASQV